MRRYRLPWAVLTTWSRPLALRAVMVRETVQADRAVMLASLAIEGRLMPVVLSRSWRMAMATRRSVAVRPKDGWSIARSAGKNWCLAVVMLCLCMLSLVIG